MKNNFRLIKITFILIFLGLVACENKEENHDQHDHSKHGKEHRSGSGLLYTCPMPEDSVFSDQPGNCPKCGMELIKVDKEKVNANYSCPMHPEVVSEGPGICPICKMDLEPVVKKETDTIAFLIKPANQFVVSKLKPVVPSAGKAVSQISAEGFLTYDPEKSASVSARVAGRIEKLYVRYNFQMVKKGEKLLDIYSPELLTAQNEYLYLQKANDSTDKTLKNAAFLKLVNLGMTEGAIAHIIRSGKADPYVSIYANFSGHVHFLNGNTNISSHALGWPGAASGMENEATEGGDSQVLREGDYVKKGDVLFTIADQSSLWALFKILPADIYFIKPGEAVEVTVNNETHGGKVDFIEKEFEDFYTVRVYLKCDDHSKLKIGSLIKASISTEKNTQKGVWVPALSVLDLGRSESAVFIKKDLGYQAKAIQTGSLSGEWMEVTSGLSLSDSISPVAAYMVDSEAFIKTK